MDFETPREAALMAEMSRLKAENAYLRQALDVNHMTVTPIGVVDKYVAMAADTAMKVAPYMHAKLAALITAPGNEKTNSSLLSMLMRDLDEAGKPARYIEHIPGEGAK